MATISFKEDLIINSREKIDEIMSAMQQPRDESIASACPPKLPDNAGAIWFKHLEK